MSQAFVGFRCGVEDKVLLEKIAEKNRITLSDLIRLLVFEGEDVFKNYINDPMET